jgi:hypothetical protein
MLTPNLISQKVLWKTFWLIKHSIVDTPGSSFLAKNGGASKPSIRYQNKGYPQSTIKKNKPLRKPWQKLCPQRQDEPKRRTKRLDHFSTRMRLTRRDSSTTFRLAWDSLDGTPRPSRNLWLARPWVELVDPPHSPTLKTKVRAFNATDNHFLPPWLQQQPAWKQYQCQISLFTAHPRMGSENLSLYAPCRALFHLWSPSRENTMSIVP